MKRHLGYVFPLLLTCCGGGSLVPDGSSTKRGDASQDQDDLSESAADLSVLPDLTPRAHVTVNFDDIASCTPVGNHYPSVTITGDSSSTIIASSLIDVGQSPPNYVASVSGNVSGSCGGYYQNGFHFAFTSPVYNLRLNAVGVDSISDAATIQVTYGTGQIASQTLVGPGSDRVAVPIDLSSYEGVTKLDVSVVDVAGIGFDDLSFDQ